jgi:hypothetical protein
MLRVKYVLCAFCLGLFVLLSTSCSRVKPEVQNKNIRFSYASSEHHQGIDLSIKIINQDLNVVHSVKYDVYLSNSQDQEWIEYSRALDLLPGDSVTIVHTYSNVWTNTHAYLNSF